MFAASQVAATKEAEIGLSKSAATHEVRNAFQPPSATGTFLARRATTDCQSISTMFTLKPPRSSSDLATGAKFVSTCRSVECMSSTGVPS